MTTFEPPTKRRVREDTPVPPARLFDDDMAPIGGDMGLVYRLNNFPPEYATQIPYADGRVDQHGRAEVRRQTEPYNADWVRRVLDMQIAFVSDPIVEFVQLTAGLAGMKFDSAWEGGDPSRVNFMLTALQTPIGAEPASAADTTGSLQTTTTLQQHMKAMEQELAKMANVGTVSALTAMNKLMAEKQRAAAAADKDKSGAGGAAADEPSRDLQHLRSSVFFARTATDAMYPEADKPAAATASTSMFARPSAASAAAPQPSAAITTTDPAKQPLQARPIAGHQARTMPGPSSVREGLAAEVQARKAAEDKLATSKSQSIRLETGEIVEGFMDPWVMLFRLMTQKPAATDTQLKMWRLFFGVAEPPKEAAGKGSSQNERLLDELSSPSKRLRLMEDINRLARLLDRTASAGGASYVTQPRHTGVLFFSASFKAAVRSAMGIVRNVCGHPEVDEAALMTDVGVRDAFSRLVAFYLRRMQSSALGMTRFGAPTRETKANENMELRLLQIEFRQLRRDSYGRLTLHSGVPQPGDKRSGKGEAAQYL